MKKEDFEIEKKPQNRVVDLPVEQGCTVFFLFFMITAPSGLKFIL